ncbi:uncharacterized protein LY79DRAFT_542466 [Colletotrichum navitas]|uniref:Uncharacterized protein n=1 Tax=Colletotrichum navitas TaxID=681940 RepID=A0AAD8VA93_9PEZI|nr:uncharacterized protein LY79DRAFT_542466 [Colletotrichum navitas]KAK1597200.1 hypothetical protein LY79DRAFT_542466 [Colletotrichum navitas]
MDGLRDGGAGYDGVGRTEGHVRAITAIRRGTAPGCSCKKSNQSCQGRRAGRQFPVYSLVDSVPGARMIFVHVVSSFMRLSSKRTGRDSALIGSTRDRRELASWRPFVSPMAIDRRAAPMVDPRPEYTSKEKLSRSLYCAIRGSDIEIWATTHGGRSADRRAGQC